MMPGYAGFGFFYFSIVTPCCAVITLIIRRKLSRLLKSFSKENKTNSQLLSTLQGPVAAQSNIV